MCPTKVGGGCNKFTLETLFLVTNFMGLLYTKHKHHAHAMNRLIKKRKTKLLKQNFNADDFKKLK